MCVKWSGDWHETDKDIVAYKVVKREHRFIDNASPKDGVYYSFYTPSGRGAQTPDGNFSSIDDAFYWNRGELFTYTIGEELRDDDNEGIYLYVDDPFGFIAADYGETAVTLEVLIPAGTKVRRGILNDGSGNLTINARRILVLSEV